jgi:hypothetical protein
MSKDRVNVSEAPYKVKTGNMEMRIDLFFLHFLQEFRCITNNGSKWIIHDLDSKVADHKHSYAMGYVLNSFHF